MQIVDLHKRITAVDDARRERLRRAKKLTRWARWLNRAEREAHARNEWEKRYHKYRKDGKGYFDAAFAATYNHIIEEMIPTENSIFNRISKKDSWTGDAFDIPRFDK